MSGFYRPLTELRACGYLALRNVCAMTYHLIPASGREDSTDPRLRITSNDLGVRRGESDPARMVSGVLVLVAVMIVMALVVLWWLI